MSDRAAPVASPPVDPQMPWADESRVIVMVAVDTEEALTMIFVTPGAEGAGSVCEAVEPERYEKPDPASVEAAVEFSTGSREPGVPTT